MQFSLIPFKTKSLAVTELGAGTTWYRSYFIDTLKVNTSGQLGELDTYGTL
jgi:hypothetical protein